MVTVNSANHTGDPMLPEELAFRSPVTTIRSFSRVDTARFVLPISDPTETSENASKIHADSDNTILLLVLVFNAQTMRELFQEISDANHARPMPDRFF